MNTAAPNAIRIAVVDDHAMFRKGVIGVLEKAEGIQVTLEAGNGRELLHALSSAIPEHYPHLCVMDIRMPVLGGYETLVSLRKLYPKIRVLTLTMMDDEVNVIRMLQAGSSGYLLKEEDPEKLIEAVHAVMEKGFYDNELTAVYSRRAAEIKFQLTKREEELLGHCATDKTYKEIAALMGISTRTVESYRDSLFEKLHRKTRIGLAMYALQTGFAKL